MTRTRTSLLAALAALSLTGLSLAMAPAGTAAVRGPAVAPAFAAVPEWLRTPVTFTTTTLDFKVPVNDGGETCNVQADLRIPAGVDATHPAPAILTSNGFGGSKDSTGATASNGSYAMQYAAQGYVTLSYSGLGFGKSTCQIELDSPAFDGQAGAALVDFLGGDTSDAYTGYTVDQTGTTAGTWTGHYDLVPPVQLDDAATHDPRVGMIGGSYGGENQFAVASVSQKVDTIIPQITWNDLVYSLAPNNQAAATDPAGSYAPVTQTDAAPGVEKFEWVSLFFGLGNAQVAMGNGGPVAGSPCPDFDVNACPAKVQMDAVGYPDPMTTAFAHSASASTYLNRIHIPVFLSQGQDDTLFTLREAATTFKTLQAAGVRVKMLWQQWGHSGGAVTGEANGTSAVPQLFDDLRYSAWFAKYLRGDSVADTGPAFEYYTPWLTSNGTATTPDTAQMSGAANYPVGHQQTLYLSGGSVSGTGSLVSSQSAVTAGTADFAVTPSTATSYTETSAVDQSQPVTDEPGTFAAFSSPPLAENADQVGSPTLTVNLSAPSFAVSGLQPAGQLVLFAKLYDVSPSGTITLANRLIAPTRVTDVTKPVTIHLPAVVHRYPAGDHLEVVLSSGDLAYKGNNTAAPVQVVTDATHVNTLTVPLTDADGIVLSGSNGPGSSLPEVGTPVLLALVAFAAGSLLLLRRRGRRA